MWMMDPEIQLATASEPLSLEEELAMQISWAIDEKKCTFIILDPTTADTPGTGHHGLGGMAGDVNLFWNDHDDELHTAEIEIMVAAKESRRKGIAKDALRLMMAYGTFQMGVRTFRAKVGFDNLASLALFQGLGYTEVSRSEVFREVTLEVSTEASTGVSTEASTEESTGVSINASVQETSRVLTGVSTEASTRVSTWVSTEASMELSTGVSAGVNTGPPVGRDGSGGDAAAAVEKSWVLSSITQEAWNAVAKGTYDSDTATGETMCT